MSSILVRDIIEFAHAHKVPEGHMVGQQMSLMDWQVEWLDGVFGDGDVLTGILSVARRNGKTGLAAVVVAAALYGPLALANSMVLSASRSRDQAAIIHNYVSKMAQMSGFASQLAIKPSLKQIHCHRTGVDYSAVSADAATQHGKGARILVTDELGQVRGPRDELYETMSTGMGSYTDSKHIIISTRAPSDNDLFNILLDDAITGLDKTTFGMEFTADEELEVDDPEAWRQANPSLRYGVRDLGDLERQAREAKRIPSREAAFRNLILNQKVDAKAPFITPGVWKTGSRAIKEELFLTQPVYAGLDLSARKDVTALVLAVSDPETLEVHVKPYCWVPEEGLIDKAKTERVPYDLWVKQGYLQTVPGNAIHYEHLAEHIATIMGQYEIITVNFDRWRVDQLTYELDKIGFYLPLEPFGQGYKDMSPAVDETESLLLDSRLIHGGNPVLTSHISNVIIDMDPTRARKPNKAKSINKIDVAVAMMMAVAAVKNTAGEDGLGLCTSGEMMVM